MSSSLLAPLVATACFCSGAIAETRPNVLLILVDDLRPELGCYGATHARTPHLDKLSREAVTFDRAYCTVPICGPSRASLLTGRLVTRHFSANVRADKIFPSATPLPARFREAGYTTLSFGKVFHELQDSPAAWSKKPWFDFFSDTSPEIVRFRKARAEANPKFKDAPPLYARFQPIDPVSLKKILPGTGRGPLVESPDVPDQAYPDGMLADRVAGELATLRDSNQPFFLACGFLAPHLPFYAPRKYWDMYDREKIPLANNPYRPKNAPAALTGSKEFTQYHLDGLSPGTEAFSRMMKHGYLASTSYVDAQIGKVLEALEKTGLARNTIVVVWGDHGWNLGEHAFWGKHTLTDTAMRLPLLVRVPGQKSGRCPAPVSSVDLYPTLCELAGITLQNAELDGTSLRALLANPTASHERPVFCNFRQGRTVLDGTHAYTEYGPGGPGKRMLFNHANDPDENHNIAETPEAAQIVARLSRLLERNKK